jgi:dihydroorotase
MSERPLLITNGRLLDPAQGLDGVGDLLLEEGVIRGVRVKARGHDLPAHASTEIIDAKGLAVCPGFVDLHCHLREPGFEHKETIASGTRAAAAGGFTTVCCMPNTSPPLDSPAALEYVRKKAAQEGAIRVLPIGCVTRERRGEQLADLMELADAGAVAFSDDGDPVANPHLMRQALSYSLPLGRPIVDHCEDKALGNGGSMHEGLVCYRLGLRGIPAAAEEAMVARDLALAHLTGGWVHIAHVSTAGSVELVRKAKAQGVRVTTEVTPHHLLLTDEWVMGKSNGPLGPHAYDTNAKVNPPLRTRKDTEALLAGLKDGTLDAIATDHAPHSQVDKECEFDKAAFGISGIETAFGLLMGLVHQGKLDLSLLIARLTAGPARIAGQGYWGLKVGAPAELAILDLERSWTVDPSRLLSLGKNTPLGGISLRGKVMATVFGGKVVFQDLSLPHATTIRKRPR